MAFEVLTAVWKARSIGDARLSVTEKCVLARLADYWRADSKVAAISMEQLAADCGLSAPGLRGVMRRLLVHVGCPRHLDVQSDPGGEGCCLTCRSEFQDTGCVRIITDETASRARRYDILTDRLRGKAAYPLQPSAGASEGSLLAAVEGNPVTPGGQPAFPLEGNLVTPGGKAAYPVPDLPEIPDVPEKITGAGAPALTEIVEAHNTPPRKPSVHDEGPEAVERTKTLLAETRRRILTGRDVREKAAS